MAARSHVSWRPEASAFVLVLRKARVLRLNKAKVFGPNEVLVLGLKQSKRLAKVGL